MLTLFGYQITSLLYDGFRTQVYRGIRQSDGQQVAIKLHKSDYPSYRDLVQFRHQYTITKNLDIPGIIKPYSLETYGNGLALVMEDFGGISLPKYTTHQPLPIGEFLLIARQIVQILASLHHHRIIHKDIKPHNLLINPHTKEIKLIDFSISSLLPRETQEIQTANLLEGTFAYIAPEQTGRMNRGIDYRSDFYSLGVTFYELLTGQLPCHSTDPMELVHYHIAIPPTPPIELNPTIPQPINDMIMKLIAKTAEYRYQSAIGILHDLEICHQQLLTQGEILPFAIAQRDISNQFLIPEKLYGREQEVKTLLEAFDRVAQGYSEILLVAGFSGIGKTAVVNEVHKPIVRFRGYFIKGKFDQFKRNIPFAPLIQAFQNLLRQLFTESADRLAIWKEKLAKALGENGQVIIDVIPEVELLISKQPPVVELGPTETQNRFNLVFQNFIKVFTSAQHPLVIFLDDLQWADSASLKLIQLLMTETDTKYLFLIGAYRDNEVSPVHPTILTLDNIKKAGATVNQIVLQPLDLWNLNRLIADALTCTESRAKPLSEQVFQKTEGNPFFATQFLKSLYDEALLQYDINLGYWQCDIAKVKALAVSDNVVEFMASVLQKLPRDAQDVLKLAACIGHQFDLETLSIVYEKSPTETAANLWKALQSGLVLPISEVYKFFQSDGNGEESTQLPITNDQLPNYKFLHDRVQQAAYSLIPEGDKKATHLKIGKLLLKNTNASELEEKIFDIVNQVNVGVELIDNQLEKDEIATLNLIAGLKAKSATAYEPAVRYFNLGIGLLTADSWIDQYDLTLNLHVEAVEAEYLNTNFERAKRLSESVLQQAKYLLEKIKVYELKIQFYVSQNQPHAAIETALEVLKMLGVQLSTKRKEIVVCAAKFREKLLWGDKQISDLADLPVMTDPYQLAAMRILVNAASAAFHTNPALLQVIVLTMVELCIKHGNSPLAAFAYSYCAILLCGIYRDINSGYQFGQLAIAVLEKFNARVLKAKIIDQFNVFVRHWKAHAREAIEPFLEAIQSGIETGDIEYAFYGAVDYCNQLFFIGEMLDSVSQKQAQYLEVMGQLKLEFHIYYCQIGRQMVLNLLGKSADPCRLQGASFDESKMLPIWIKENNIFFVFCTYCCQTILLYLFKKYADAQAAASLGEKYEKAGGGMLYVPEHNFYYSLALLANSSNYESLEPKKLAMKKVTSNQKKMKYWAHHAPMNFQHKYDLVEAEKARVKGQMLEAIEYYDRAISGAKNSKYIQEEAIANELAASFYLAWGKETIAQAYITNAYSCYKRWGAEAKVQDLEKSYPQLLAPILKREENTLTTGNAIESITSRIVTHTISETSAILDLTTLMKSYQAITSEIELNKLLKELIKIVLENAGAQLGVFILNQEERLLIEAVGKIAPEQISVRQSIPVENSEQLPLSVINYVARTHEDVILTNASQQGNFTDDPYILAHETRSVLCTPILSQGKLIGILYLENNLTAGAFTKERSQLLKLLCSQAAISLENAQLYEAQKEYAKTLERQVQERTRELQQQKAWFDAFFAASSAGFSILDKNLRYVQINEAMAEINGVPLADHFGKRLREVLPHLAPVLETTYEQILTTGEPLLNFEVSGETASQPGVERYWIVSLFPLPDPDGRPIGVGAVVVEIGDRKRAEQALQEQEEFLRSIYEGVEQAIFVVNVDLDGEFRFARWNRVGEAIVGVNSSEAIGKTPEEVFEEAIAATLRQNYTACIEAGTAISYEECFTLEGSEIWSLTTLTPLRDATERIHRIIGTATNITARKKAEEALKVSEERYRRIIETSYEGVWMIDTDGRTNFVNARMVQMLGYTVEEMLGKHLFEFMDAEGQAIASAEIERRRQDINENYDFRFHRKDGSTLWAIVSTTAIFNQAGRFTGTLAMITDITERKQAEAALQKAKETADAASRAKGEFLSKMSHELRTPLNAILGFTQILNRDPSLTSQQQEYLGIINRAGEHLLTLINDVLEMSKIEAGRIELHENTFDLYRLLNSLEEMFQLKAESKGLQLTFNMAPDVPQYVKADESKLRQVLINLLGNAIKFTSTGSVYLKVKSEEVQSSHYPLPTTYYLTFEVSDTGPGIAPEEIDTLFEAFMQTETGKKSQSGTGLGLPISRQFVQLMGGEITVSSNLNRGTIFKFDIQIRLPENTELPTPTATQRAIALEPNQPTYRILVVEDQPESRLLLVNLLSQLGFEVREAVNGEEAVTLTASWQPHLIWMDMQMPVMNGYEATKQIKAITQNQAPVIIALTASAFAEDKAAILEAGCDDFISKPFRAEAIFEKIAQYLGVRYIYEQTALPNAQKPKAETASFSLDSDSSQGVSSEWIAQLHQAAIELDDELVGDLIGEIGDSHPQLANTLKEFTKKLRFDRIVEFLEKLKND